MSEPPDLRALHSFVTIAQEGSISRAAARLNISQQSLSVQMRMLETRIGAAVLVRSSRGVTLTAVGEVLLREAVPLLGSAARAMDAVARSARGEGLELRVGFLSSLANEVMPPVVSLFAAADPSTELQTSDLGIADLVADVRSGVLDAAVTRPPLVDDLHGDLLGSEGVVIALPLVAAGVGITRLAASSRSLRAGGVRFVPLAGERAGIVLLTRHGATNPALTAFREALLEALTGSLDGFEPEGGDGS